MDVAKLTRTALSVVAPGVVALLVMGWWSGRLRIGAWPKAAATARHGAVGAGSHTGGQVPHETVGRGQGGEVGSRRESAPQPSHGGARAPLTVQPPVVEAAPQRPPVILPGAADPLVRIGAQVREAAAAGKRGRQLAWHVADLACSLERQGRLPVECLPNYRSGIEDTGRLTDADWQRLEDFELGLLAVEAVRGGQSGFELGEALTEGFRQQQRARQARREGLAQP